MFAADCEEWLSTICPNLPKEHYTEYTLLLAEFLPEIEFAKIDFKKLSRFQSWCYPFVDMSEEELISFYEKYENHIEKTEEELMDKYDLDYSVFCTF